MNGLLLFIARLTLSGINSSTRIEMTLLKFAEIKGKLLFIMSTVKNLNKL